MTILAKENRETAVLEARRRRYAAGKRRRQRTAGQSLGTRSLWITFTMRKCVARKTPGDATPKNNL